MHFCPEKGQKGAKVGGAGGKNQLFCLLFKIGSFIFFHILHKVSRHYRVKTAPNTIFQKNFHFPINGKNVQKGLKIGFLDFCAKLSHYFLLEIV